MRRPHTIGGGSVLDPLHRRASDVRSSAWGFSRRSSACLAGEGITALLQQARFGVKISDLVR